MKTIKEKEYNKIPILYDNSGDFDRHQKLEVGNYYIMRELLDPPSKGDVVSVYEVIRVTNRGHESKVTMLRIE